MSTDTLEAPAAETAAPETQAATKPAPGAEVAVRTVPANMALGAKMKYAQMLAESGLLPKDYRGKPANVLYAVEYGQMLGLQPMAAITGIHIIEGKPSASAGLISALVRRAGHKLRVTGDAKSATCTIVRADDPDYQFTVTFTIVDAATAGLTGKDVWKKYAASMLKARAVSQCARDACEEALFGLHYTPEELGAPVDGDGNILMGEVVTDADPWLEPPVETDQPWLAGMLQKAAGFADAEAGRHLWRETTAKTGERQCTAADAKQVTDLIMARIEDLKAAETAGAAHAEAEVVDAELVDEPVLSPEDDWTVAIGDILGAEDGAAAKASLKLQLKNGSITVAYHDQVLAAIDARLAGLGVTA